MWESQTNGRNQAAEPLAAQPPAAQPATATATDAAADAWHRPSAQPFARSLKPLEERISTAQDPVFVNSADPGGNLACPVDCFEPECLVLVKWSRR